MVSESEVNGGNLVCELRFSTVVPASITGTDKDHELSDMDLAMKLHYISTVHFFGGDAAEGLSIQDLKKPMFQWLQLYYPICGRLRRSRGRPYVKCNDSGVRIIEATATKTMSDWLHAVTAADHHRLLVYNQPLLAHDFGFTPLVFLQLTKFKCGGLCVGMRWAHILGDAFSALECINMWGRIMANQTLPPQLLDPPMMDRHPLGRNLPSCPSVKLLESLGDNWTTPNNSKMQMHTFHVSEEQLHFVEKKNKNKYNINVKAFDLISAIIWKSIAKLKEIRVVTVCKRRSFDHIQNELPSNGHQMIGHVEADQTMIDSDPLEIAKLIAEKLIDETSMIGEPMEEGNGNYVDLVVYGSNLTFVDLEEVDLYGLQLKGHVPVFANLSIGGAGDEGVVVVVPDSGGDGKVVNVTLPQEELQHLKNELMVEWSIL